jgi:signal recognition particle GTPase
MNIDELRLKRLREALGATRELRHTTHAARKHVAAAIRMQRPAGNRLRRKLRQLVNLTEQVDLPDYTLDDFVSDLLNALTYEAERLQNIEKDLVAVQKKVAKRIESGKAQAKLETKKTARQKRVEQKKARRDSKRSQEEKRQRLRELSVQQREVVNRMVAKAKASGDAELLTHIQKQIIQAQEMPRLTPNIVERLNARGLDEYAADFRIWFDAHERAEELKG